MTTTDKYVKLKPGVGIVEYNHLLGRLTFNLIIEGRGYDGDITRSHGVTLFGPTRYGSRQAEPDVALAIKRKICAVAPGIPAEARPLLDVRAEETA